MENLYYTPMSPQRAELRKQWNGSGLDWDQYLEDAEILKAKEMSVKNTNIGERFINLRKVSNKKFRLPRKTKKELKKLILKDKDPLWKTKECKITYIQKHSRYSKNPTYKGITVTGYNLGL